MELKHLIVACIALVGLVAVGGVASADTYTGLNSTDMPVNDTFAVTDDTSSLNVMAENITNDTATVTVYGVDSGGNLTEVANASMSTNESGGVYTDSYSYTNINASQYGSYKLSFSADGADTVELYALERDSGTAGAGFLGGGVPMTEVGGLLLVVVVMGGLWMARRD